MRVCHCGCGKRLVGKQTRWASVNCRRISGRRIKQCLVCQQPFKGRQRKYCLACKDIGAREAWGNKKKKRNYPVGVDRKKCSDCQETKSWELFSRDRTHVDGLNSICKECARIRHAEWRATSKGKVKDHSLQRNYDITIEEYFQILDFQGGGCAICGLAFEANGKALAVDHDHRLGIVRGIVCAGCNKFKIGNNRLEDLELVVEYLRNPPAVEVVGKRLAPKKKRRPRKRKR